MCRSETGPSFCFALLRYLALSCAILRHPRYLLEGAWNPRPPRLSLALTRSAGRGLQLQMSLDELHQDVFVAQVSATGQTPSLHGVRDAACPISYGVRDAACPISTG